MALFNHTSVYLNTRKSKGQHDRTIYRVPVPQENETFFYSQESIEASVSINKRTKSSKIVSIHVTSQRLVLLSQLSSIGPPLNSEYFDTFEIQLIHLISLKSVQSRQKMLHFDIVLLNQNHVKIDLLFNNKKDADKGTSLVDYLKMAASNLPNKRRLQQERRVWDTLPTYFEATCSFEISPPAYK